MRAIYKRELRACFNSFIGWLFLAVVLFFTGLYVTANNLAQGSAYLTYALQSSLIIFIIAVPILTMRILAEERKNNLVMYLAHDIRTPLTGACGYLQLAQECPEPEKQDHYLQCAGSRLKELEEMLEKMFLYTKLTSEEFTLSRKRLQVSPLLGDCLLGMYGAFQEKGVSPQVDFEMEGFTIQGDAEALRRVFLNLIQNALVHGTGGIAITQRGDCLIFENPVENTEGLNLDLIFERFYKGDTARRKGSSGLGLYIVRELTHRMGGDVHVELEAGNLRITLCFPAAKHNSHQ